MSRLKAVPGQIIVVRDSAKDTTEGGLALPDQAKKRPRTGSVVEHKDSKACPVQFEPGTKVVFGAYAGEEFEIVEKCGKDCALPGRRLGDGSHQHEYMILAESEVIAFVENEK